MAYAFAEKLFYSAFAFVLGAAFFVLQPTANPEIAQFKNEIKQEFGVAALQVFGDQPVMLDSVEFVFSSVNEFYLRSADAFIVLVTPNQTQDDLILVVSNVYETFKYALNPQGVNQPQVLGTSVLEPEIGEDFMTEEPVFNIVPSHQATETPRKKVVLPEPAKEIKAAVATQKYYPAANDSGNDWVNLRDNSTGQIYCVAIYNAEVNRYLGPCAGNYR